MKQSGKYRLLVLPNRLKLNLDIILSGFMKGIQSDNMFTISLENYTVMAKHGAYDFEHESDQPFNVSIKVEISQNDINDDLSKTVNYADLQSTIDSVLIDSKAN